MDFILWSTLILIIVFDDNVCSLDKIFTHSVVLVSSNLIGSQSQINWALFTTLGVNDALSKQSKIASLNFCFDN